jgi:hypothetical protein
MALLTPAGDAEDGMVGVFLDHNVWHELFKRGRGIDAELPASEFAIGITREAEFEILAIPASHAELRHFIAQTLADPPTIRAALAGRHWR